MKRIFALILAIAFVFALFGCKNEKYPEIESTEEEATVLMTFKIDDDKYELKYELYRALFLNFSSEYDGGNKSFWNSSAASGALSEINERIIDYCADIFAVLHLSDLIGFDPYSDEAEELIQQYIETSVEGGDGVTGFDGDYDAYIASLKAANMNYSVQKLLLRYSIAYDKVIEYYEGTVNESNPTENESGALEVNRDKVYEFYLSEKAARVSLIVLNANYVTLERAGEIRDIIASKSTADEALLTAVQMTAGDPADILNGVLIGTYTLDNAYYSEVTKTAFEMNVYDTSKVISVVTDYSSEYWILYKQEKDSEYFDYYYDSMVSVYISQRIGEIIENAKATLINSCTETDAYKNLRHGEISMK